MLSTKNGGLTKTGLEACKTITLLGVNQPGVAMKMMTRGRSLGREDRLASQPRAGVPAAMGATPLQAVEDGEGQGEVALQLALGAETALRHRRKVALEAQARHPLRRRAGLAERQASHQ